MEKEQKRTKKNKKTNPKRKQERKKERKQGNKDERTPRTERKIHQDKHKAQKLPTNTRHNQVR